MEATETLHSTLPYVTHPETVRDWVSNAPLYQPIVPLDLGSLQKMPLRKVKLGLDIDGVCADFVGGVLEVWFQETGLLVDRMQLDQWSIFDCEGLLDRDVVSPRVEQPGFCAGLRAFPEAKEALPKLRQWADVYAVTSPWNESKHWVGERMAWLERELQIDYHHQIHTHAKDLVRVDVLVDDRPANVAKWGDAFPQGRALLWDTPHNRKEHAGIRVRSWEEVLWHVMSAGMTGGNNPFTLH